MFEFKFENTDAVTKGIQAYAKSLKEKTEKFVELLSERGITVAQEAVAKGTHQMPQRIRFEKEITTDKAYVLGVITGTGDTFISHWMDSDFIEHIDEVFPLAMMEFGSAMYALEPQEAFGGSGGRGTFSVSGNSGKAEWYVTVMDEGTDIVRRKHATAIFPTRPMYNAMLAMQRDIISCAEKAFGE